LPSSGEWFEVGFADADGDKRLPLVEAWSVPFEMCRPVREFPSYKVQRQWKCPRCPPALPAVAPLSPDREDGTRAVRLHE
jgi:hypothetical protein